MRKIFILGGSDLQLDLILEAKKMFFYTVVVDMNKECIGSRWCDKFLHIDIADKELVLKKAREYKIDMIFTSATELGNVTACYVGEKLGLNTNSYQVALNTTQKSLMKKVLKKNNIRTAKFIVKKENQKIKWNIFPCIVKPSDASSAKGISYCTKKDELAKAIQDAKTFSRTKEVLIEEYIEGKQYSCETISSFGEHQIITYNKEYIKNPPNIIETKHKMSQAINQKLSRFDQTIFIILNAFNIQFGAVHLEFRIKNDKLYIIELASRTGGMRSEMINLAYGISYSQLLLLASFEKLPKIQKSFIQSVQCRFLIDYVAYKQYNMHIKSKKNIVFEPFAIKKITKDFEASHLGESKGYYYLFQKSKKDTNENR